MTGEQIGLRLVPPPAEVPLPDLAEYRGLPVTWLPWEPGIRATHLDYRCGRCGEDLGPQAMSTGTVPERRRAVPPRRRGYGYATTPEVYQVRTLMAFRCGGCGAVDVVAHADPDFWWTSGGPDRLPIGVARRPSPAPGRAPARRRAGGRAPSTAPSPPASAEHRAAMREQFARDLAARKDRLL